MRAHELVTEKLQPEIDNWEPFKKNYKVGEYDYVADFAVVGNMRYLTMKAYDATGKEVGSIDFEVVANTLMSIDTYVDMKHRRKGIATTMYRLAKELGNDVAPSQYQSRAGKKMWKGMTAKGSLDEDESGTITLWHGGKGLEHSHSEVASSKKGRWQHGPGLYLTNSYARAQEYARGGRKVYRVTINRGTDITKVELPYKDVLAFANQYVSASKRKQFLMSIQENMERMGGDTVSANVFLNLIINWEAIQSSKTNILAQFLVQHGVDYAIDKFGGYENEQVVVLFNRNKIVSVVPVVPKTIGGDDFKINPINEK